MLVSTIVLAAAGFAFLVIALATGSIVWAWACIAICIAGAVLLLVSALTSKRAVLPLDEPDRSAVSGAGPIPDSGDAPDSAHTDGGSANENDEH
ncbi:hypothetical protein [Rhodococcus sp. ARC_M6]|uniref:hypothetical protein n=1 Tax=Rhodococcus sp. ARC_M6 TaxID=2928852 RepID=UPI001FB482B7|nr:hypothetical protein [Rhodococcus sp. ARC_M6]MCJ0903748.1 hypothetical protein [Rhodococcus sp. ARC_M6]